ncbi:tRNA 2-thiouridine(34) synthase MnmA [Citricoccus muralis]|uniref:tRNA-specific 2-thiouridylase MnmA n=1 Tax=Citricoccus muralis TaxID=169134 RepID=A0A3D9LDF4_9MICC|nr:tRNA 2-thiouridine(34) synthase MnmA [Citricoccus muralis]REE03487.1 tRNA (5-methylaminomethyl-2-thiouridylate)-methyltransferase [Citricoccus muralis]
MKVLAAMSGGVDSAVAAARAVDAGHEVVGVHLALSRMPGTLRTGSRGCCTIEDSSDAWRACEKLGIPFYTWDFSERFKEDVVDDFVAEYAAGRTPNPCMRCNERIKFAALLEKALALGFDAVCTGHYATVLRNEAGSLELHRAADWAKDQSYVLGVLTAEQLEHSMFPLAETPSKDLVRAEAAERGLSVAAKPDSHDICFIPDGDTRGWLNERIEMTEGDILDTEGNRLGSHPGAQAFTVGQRKGLSIGRPAPDGRPRFVLEVRPKDNTVVVGSKEMLAVDRVTGIRPSWAGAPLAEEATGEWFDCHLQVRAHGDPVPARARVERPGRADTAPDSLVADGPVSDGVLDAASQTHDAGTWVIELFEPLAGVAPGQTAVLYQGTRVLGQSTIDAAFNAARVA